jgi:hypothetical protein
MIPEVVAYVHFLNLPVLVLGLDEAVLEEIVVVLLHLFVAHVCQMGTVGRLCRVLGVDVEVLQHDRLAERRFVVDAGTSEEGNDKRKGGNHRRSALKTADDRDRDRDRDMDNI